MRQAAGLLADALDEAGGPGLRLAALGDLEQRILDARGSGSPPSAISNSEYLMLDDPQLTTRTFTPSPFRNRHPPKVCFERRPA